MNSTITITLGQLITFIFALLGIGLFAILFLLLARVNNVLKQIQDLVSKNQENIDKTMNSLPKVIHNVEGITEVANKEMDHVQGVVKNIDEVIQHTTATIYGINDEILEPARNFLNGLSVITDMLPGKRKKGFFRK